MESLKKAIEIYETVHGNTDSQELIKASEHNLVSEMAKLMETLGHNEKMTAVKSVIVIENGKAQQGLESHFKSNQSKNEFTVKSAMFINEELTLEIETKKKKW